MFEPSGVVLFVSALALLVKPSSFGRLLVMSASAVVYLYVRSPITPNHQLFEGFVNLAILVVALRHRRLPIEAARAATFAEVASVLGMLLWMPYSVALLGALLLGWPAANSDERAGTLLHMHRSPAVALLVLFVLNGMAPYFGFQTLRTMSMFSNLRTEGGRTNHLFIPSSLQIASYQKDLVRLIGSSEPWLDFYVRNESLLPYSELRRRVWEHPDVPVQVTYERNGRIETLDTSQPGADRQVSQVPTPVNKILAFREVDQDGRPVRCLW